MPGQDDRFSEQGAALGSADVESITESCEIREHHIVLPACQAIGEPRAVDIERDTVSVTGFTDLRQFLQ